MTFWWLCHSGEGQNPVFVRGLRPRAPTAHHRGRQADREVCRAQNKSFSRLPDGWGARRCGNGFVLCIFVFWFGNWWGLGILEMIQEPVGAGELAVEAHFVVLEAGAKRLAWNRFGTDKIGVAAGCVLII